MDINRSGIVGVRKASRRPSLRRTRKPISGIRSSREPIDPDLRGPKYAIRPGKLPAGTKPILEGVDLISNTSRQSAQELIDSKGAEWIKRHIENYESSKFEYETAANAGVEYQSGEAVKPGPIPNFNGRPVYVVVQYPKTDS